MDVIDLLNQLANDGQALATGMAALTFLQAAYSAYVTYRSRKTRQGSAFSKELERRASLSLRKTGYVAAQFARYTIIITVNVIIFNVIMNAIAGVKEAGITTGSDWVALTLYAGAVLSILISLGCAAYVFLLSREIIQQAEAAEGD